MSRFRRYAFSLASGYLLMGINALYTLTSVPLALHYLGNAEFGLWALITQISLYIGLIDAGMAGSVARILVDYKDNPANPAYGSIIKTSACVNAVQSLLVLLVCFPLAPLLPLIMAVPEPLQEVFTILVRWQTVSLALTSLSRTPNLILAAHQRIDLVNYSQITCFFINFGVMWWGFHHGKGLLSVIWGQIAAQLTLFGLCCWLSWRLSLLPRPGAWGRVSWRSFKEIFFFATDLLLYSIGFQLVNASHTILIARVLGLEQAAVWSACTRAFVMANQIVLKMIDASCPPLAEMITRGENERLRSRFRSICVLTGSLCILLGVGFSVCNNLFVHLWTHGRFSWPAINNVLLSVWLLFNTLATCHASLTGLTKELRFLRYCNFVQGAVFILLSLWLFNFGGITSMLCVSILASILFGYAYTTWRTSQYLHLSWSETALGWLRQPVSLGLFLLPFALLTSLFILQHQTVGSLLLGIAFLGSLSLFLLPRAGMDPQLRHEASARAPVKFRRLLFGR